MLKTEKKKIVSKPSKLQLVIKTLKTKIHNSEKMAFSFFTEATLELEKSKRNYAKSSKIHGHFLNQMNSQSKERLDNN